MHLAAPANEPGRLYVVEQKGVIRVIVERQAPGAAVPRHPEPRHERRRAGTALGRLPPALRAEPPLLRRLHRHERRHARRRVPLGRDRARSRRRRASSSSRSSRSRTTTAASSRSARTACSTSAWATAARAATRTTTARPSTNKLAKIWKIDVNTPDAAAGARRVRPPQPVAVLVRPGDRRPLHRRRRPGHVGGDRLRARGPGSTRCRTSAGRSTRAARRTTRGRKLDPRGPYRAPIQVYSHALGCSVTGGFVYRGKARPDLVGRYFYGDYCSGTVWSLKMVEGAR